MVKKGLMQCCHILKVKEAGFVLNFRILFANATMLFHHVATPVVGQKQQLDSQLFADHHRSQYQWAFVLVG